MKYRFKMMKTLQTFIALVLVLLCGTPFAASAQDAGDGDFARRLNLARQMQNIRPARDQIDAAIEQHAARLPMDQQESFKSSLRKMLNYKALEKISVDAYADTFTEEELASMVEYYSRPEARSASAKADEYGAKVYPEIIRMLDKALMSVKTSGR